MPDYDESPEDQLARRLAAEEIRSSLKRPDPGKTHFADDDTLALIATLQSENAAKDERIKRLEGALRQAKDALEPFSEKPTEGMNNYPCHLGITTKEKCGRCGRGIAAYEAISTINEVLKK